MAEQVRPRILLVDDDVNVLEGLRRHCQAVSFSDRQRSRRGLFQLDHIASRLPPSEIIRILVSGKEQPLRYKTYIPRFGDLFRALRSYFRR